MPTGLTVFTSIVTTALNRLTFTSIETIFSVKFWLNPITLAHNFGFNGNELRRVQSLVKGHQTELLEAWNGYFGSSS
jgi:hypothetical protein